MLIGKLFFTIFACNDHILHCESDDLHLKVFVSVFHSYYLLIQIIALAASLYAQNALRTFIRSSDCPPFFNAR